MLSFVVAGRLFKQIIKDRRALALILIAPVFVLFLLSALLGMPQAKPDITAYSLPSGLVSALKEHAGVTEKDNLSDAMSALKNRETDAVITLSGSTITVSVEGTDPSVTGSVKSALAAAASEYSAETASQAAKTAADKQQQTLREELGSIFKNSPAGGAAVAVILSKLGAGQQAASVSGGALKFVYLYGSDDMTTFESVAPIMMGFFIFFFSFLLAGVSFLKERTSGTLERLLATPVKRGEIVFGYFLGFGFFALLQTLAIQLFMIYALGVTFKGSFLLVLLTNLLMACVSLSLGTLLSAFARSEFQLLQFIPIVIIPQVLFCGLFSLKGAPLWILILSKIFPLTYAASSLTNVMARGAGFSAIWPDVVVLAGFTLAFLILNSLALKKYRRL